MPEGPSIVILKEEVASLCGATIRRAEGNSTKIDKARLVGERIHAIRSWGKHFLLELHGFALRVHFLLYGSYCVDARKERAPRLSLQFAGGRELNFYNCSVRYIEGDLGETYDWRTDVMSDRWDPARAREKLRALPDTLVCDALLDQNVFAGVGNIIKNEVLFRLRIHPLAVVGAIPPRKLAAMIEQAREYSFEFYRWKKAHELKKHLLVHTKRICPRCEIPLSLRKFGKTNRRAFFCERCQRRYGTAPEQDAARARARALQSRRGNSRARPKLG